MLNAIKFKKAWLIIGVALVFAVAAYVVPNKSSAATTDVNVQVCYPNGDPAPTITDPADGFSTQQASVIVTGQSVPGSTVYAYRGSTEVGFVTAAGDGTYMISVSLNVGNNTLRTAIKDDCDDPIYSTGIIVKRLAPPTPEPEEPTDPGDPDPGTPTPVIPPVDNPLTPQDESAIPPEDQPTEEEIEDQDNEVESGGVVIAQPKDGSSFTTSSIQVTGRAQPKTKVRILLGGKVVAEVVTDSEGNFVVGVTLAEGKNTLVATIGEGNNMRFSDTVTVSYWPAGTGWWAKLSKPQKVGVVVGSTALFAVSFYFFLMRPEFILSPRKLLKILGLLK